MVVLRRNQYVWLLYGTIPTHDTVDRRTQSDCSFGSNWCSQCARTHVMHTVWLFIRFGFLYVRMYVWRAALSAHTVWLFFWFGLVVFTMRSYARDAHSLIVLLVWFRECARTHACTWGWCLARIAWLWAQAFRECCRCYDCCAAASNTKHAQRNAQRSSALNAQAAWVLGRILTGVYSEGFSICNLTINFDDDTQW